MFLKEYIKIGKKLRDAVFDDDDDDDEPRRTIIHNTTNVDLTKYQQELADTNKKIQELTNIIAGYQNNNNGVEKNATNNSNSKISSNKANRTSIDNQIIQVLKELIKRHGVEILQESNKLDALLRDYAPKLDKERKLIVEITRVGIVKSLVQLRGKNQNDIVREINNCTKQVISNTYLAENIAEEGIKIIAKAIGI